MYARLYAKVVGVTIVLIGVGGVLLGEKSLFGVLNIDIAEDAIHLVTGALMAAVGFRGSDRAVRSVVGGREWCTCSLASWASSFPTCSGSCRTSTTPCWTT